MIVARGLTKAFGPKIAVDGLSFTVEPGRVTGFLGPNGAGKSTTMRMVLGLDRPTAGSVTVNGHSYAARRRRCVRWARCSRPGRCTPGGRRATTCAGWPPATASRPGGSVRRSTWSAWMPSPTSGWAGSPSAWGSGSA